MTTETSLLRQLDTAAQQQGWDFSTFRMEWNGGGGDGGGSQGQGSGSQTGGQQQSGGQGQPSGGQAQGQPAQGQQAQQGESDYSLASSFLERVNPEHRAIVEPYVKQWDAGVTRRFQELHSQYQPYTELGDVETVDAAVKLMQMVDTDPWKVYGVLHEALMGQEPPPGFGQQQQGAGLNGQQQSQQNPFGQQGQGGLEQQGLSGADQGQLPEAVQQELSQLRNAVTVMAQHMLGQNQQQTQAEEDAQLDQYLTQLHEEFGDFDERYVLGRLHGGESVEDAIKGWNEAVETRAKAQLQKNGTVPHVLGGGGAPAGEGTTPKDLSRKDTQSLVANVLARAAQARNR